MKSLVQLLLPLYDAEGRPFPREAYDGLRTRLTERFGGLTAYSRAPAEGWWQPEPGRPARRDDVVIFEVLAGAFERDRWTALKHDLEARFRQDEILVRAQAVDVF
jgi:hypothetical protein